MKMNRGENKEKFIEHLERISNLENKYEGIPRKSSDDAFHFKSFFAGSAVMAVKHPEVIK